MQSVFKASLEKTERDVRALNWRDRQVYGDFLFQTYCFVSHSTRLLALAASRLGLEQNELHARFVAHLNEEKGHERLAEMDLKKLGFNLNSFQERGITRAFYESQYFKIEHQAPTALLGYILFLEGAAVLLGPIAHTQTAEEFGSDATRFLKVHVAEDPSHVDQAFQALARLSPTETRYVQENLEQSCDVYCKMLTSIQASATEARTVTAPRSFKSQHRKAA